MIAKNVGIRRARGDTVLATNIDILFSPELMDFFARKRLQDNKMYRVDRYDVNPNIPADGSIADQMKSCSENIMKINTKNGTIPVSGSGVNNQIFWKIKTIISPFISPIYRKIRCKKSKCKAILHTQACGDFTLIKRTRWLELRGYPEFPICSMHIDSLLCYTSHFAGSTEEVLYSPYLIYHMDHGSGWSTEKERMRSFYKKLEKKGIPYLDDSQLFDWTCFMQKTNKPIFFNNGDSWGLGEKILHEDRIN